MADPVEELIPIPAEFPHDLAWRGPLAIWRDAIGPGSETADEFHFASAVTVLGLLLGRHFFVRYPYPHYPNFFTCLVGPTAKARKTAAMRAAFDNLFTPLVGSRIPKYIDVARGMGGSGEGLLTQVSDRGGVKGRSLLIYEEELAVVLRKMRQEGSTLAGFLLQAADSQPTMSLSTRRNPATATQATIGLLAASTSEWLESDSREEDVRGGLVNRMMWFYGSDKASVAFPDDPPEDLLQKITAELIWMPTRPATRGFAVDLTDAARKYHQVAYEKAKILPAPSPLARAATARTHSHAIRIALLYAVLERRPLVGHADAVAIDLPHIEAAWAVARYCAAVASHLFVSASHHPDAKIDRAMLRALGVGTDRARPLHLRDLRRLTCAHLSAGKAFLLVRGLENMGYVSVTNWVVVPRSLTAI